jgi:copper resistance protein B
MRRLPFLAFPAALIAMPAAAQHAEHGAAKAPSSASSPAADIQCPPEDAAMGHCKLDAQPPGAAASNGPEHAADAVWGAAAMAEARRAVHAEHGGFSGGRVLLDRLEYRVTNDRDGYAWEGDAWFGGDYDRLWLKTEGEGTFGERLERGEAQALLSRAIDPWFNLQAGIRQDFGARGDRTHLVLGVQGLAPYWFELDAALFLSTRGDLGARIAAEYDQRLTNRLIVQPRIELDLAAQDVRELGVGAGLSSIAAGVRLRYEPVPEFAPYLGIDYERAVGRTADLARATGEGTGGWAFVAGVRMWF